ncbi:SseB family protein [Dyella koreensis]|uniref:SseB family protein n=1 Tax=Dyella koreensis TaxID=311235 RepID=A0ABW8K821_9GAMM
MDKEERNERQAPPELLEALWLNAGRDAPAEGAFLRALSHHPVVALLRQPPGPGPAAPERNLVQWQRRTDGMTFVPIFTNVQQLSIAPPAPVQIVRTSIRLLLAVVGSQGYIVNPLSDTPFELKEAHRALLHDHIARAHQEAEHPSRKAPWAFQLPDDTLFPVAVALVEWFNQHDRVDLAFLYELTRGHVRRSEIVLGLDEPADVVLADTLTTIAIQAGVDAARFIVRFLPDESSHREGIVRGGIRPFYQRPGR